MSESARAIKMTLEQKRSLYRDGLVILKQAVPDDMIEAALRGIHDAKKGEYVGPRREITDLVNASSITPILNEAMGQFDPPTNCQVAITKISKPGDNFAPLGYRDRDVPYFGASIHMDGSITIASPQEVQDGTPEEI